jgi:hypothetical protein
MLRRMKHRVVLLVTCAAMAGGGLFAGACSSSSKGTFTQGDGSVDSSSTKDGGDSSVTMTDTGPVQDSGMPPADAIGPGTDTGVVGPTDAGEGGSPVDAPLANCSPIQGSCDIVSQNCGANMECVAFADPDGGPGAITSCSPAQPSEHLPAGHSCCPSGTNPCDPGLECIGNMCDPDAAAPQTGRCTPHCCLGPDGGNDTPCGMSVPEGYPGHCDLTIVDNANNPLYAVCSYSQNCKPLRVEPCPPGSACLVQDNSGTSTCTAIYNPGGDAGGIGPGQPCNSGNDCADGLECLGPAMGDGGSTCLQLCFVPGQSPPFDAGNVAEAGPGFGGCPAAQNCGSVDPSLFPAWLGLCQ